MCAVFQANVGAAIQLLPQSFPFTLLPVNRYCTTYHLNSLRATALILSPNKSPTKSARVTGLIRLNIGVKFCAVLYTVMMM
jgi:hypothetical protein